MADPQTLPLILRNSSVAGAVPAASEFNLNTLVHNSADGMLYWLDNSGKVVGMPIRPGTTAGELQLASAATTDLSTLSSSYIAITGTAAITSFGTGKNLVRFLRFTSAGLVLTYNGTSLIIPGAQNVTTQAGDMAMVSSDANGNWTVRSYQRADGTSLVTIGSAVRYDAAQALSDTQLLQARNNLRSFPKNIIGINANTTLDASACNVQYIVTTGGNTIALPPVAQTRVGDMIAFGNSTGVGSAPATITRASGDASVINGATSFTLRPGETVRLISNGAAYYFADWAPYVGSVLNFDAAQTLSAAQKTQGQTNLGAQAALGFTPAQQGGGTNMGVNKVIIGWKSDGTSLLAQVDGTPLGRVWTDYNAGVSIGANGYQKLPSGLIVQWGSNYDNQTNDPTVTYPVAFPNGVLSLTSGPASNLGSTGAVAYFFDSVTTSNFVCRRRVIYNGGTVGYAYAGFYWMAVGY